MIKIRRAVATEARPLIGLYAQSGCGKTFSALLLARGFCGDMARVCMVETESGRGEAFADDPRVGGYQVISLRDDFAPRQYGEAISEAERAGVQALIVDSGSHEWAGVGGVLAMAAKNQEEGRKGPIVWQRPKIEHAREFVSRLLQTPIPLVVLCMRARFPMYEVKPGDVQRWEDAGKPGGDKARPKVGEWARAWELEPIQSEEILFEMFFHAWIDQDHKLHVTKTTVDSLHDVFTDGARIDVATGERLRAWSDRANKNAKVVPKESAPAPDDESQDSEPITTDQRLAIETALKDRGVPLQALLDRARITAVADMPAASYQRALDWIYRQPRNGAAS